MKRSQVNEIINAAKGFFTANRFALPRWAYWAPADWKGRYADCAEIIDNMLGWDVTSFGGSDFDTRGLTAFTLRNGPSDGEGKRYGEKILVVGENQETPLHFHWSKMEDIINRGAGTSLLNSRLPHRMVDSLRSRPRSLSTESSGRLSRAALLYSLPATACALCPVFIIDSTVRPAPVPCWSARSAPSTMTDVTTGGSRISDDSPGSSKMNRLFISL